MIALVKALRWWALVVMLLRLDGIINLFAVDRDTMWCLNTNTDLAAPDVYDHHFNIITDHYLFVF